MRTWVVPVLLVTALLRGASLAAESAAPQHTSDADLLKDFADPPLRFKSRPLWFWNAAPNPERTREQLNGCKERGYFGVGILPCYEGRTFMKPEFLAQYKIAVEHAASLGMKMCLYDEFWYPSGSAGGLLAGKFPEALGRRLDMLAVDVTGPKEVVQPVTNGVFMGAVAMETASYKRLNISDAAKNGTLTWNAPAGNWKVMVFTCVRPDGKLVDYLSPEAVKRFIELTYQTYHDAFPEHFGTTIDSAFYDEPAMYHVQGGRAWTERFNEKFREKHGQDPVIHYPALWFDIGPDTAAARNALFGFRAELFSTGFVKTVGDWCREHRIQLTGHVDQEELVNPVIGQAGDLIKAFKHQDIPGIDQIAKYGRASPAYKVVSSAAYNYDRPLVMTECYGGMDNPPQANLYKEAMDQYAKGINLMVPHAVWYEPAGPRMVPPDLSPGSAVYGPHLPEFNRYIGRCQRMLQGGRHVADIAVLYPIATLQAGSWFGPGDPYGGCVRILDADYMDVGERLALDVRRDFTFVHPEVFDERCRVEGAEIVLDNKVNWERHRIFILPGSAAIHASTARKLRTFFENGGRIIATTRLPDTSAEFGCDTEVREAMAAIFESGERAASVCPRFAASSTWELPGWHGAILAADRDLKTCWAARSRSGGGQWLEVDFGEKKTFAKTVVTPAGRGTTAYRIQAWDGSRWLDCVTGKELDREKADAFPAITAAKVRLCIDQTKDSEVSIAEFAVLDAQGQDLAARPRPAVRENARGGRAAFLINPTAEALRSALDAMLPSGDVVFEAPVKTRGGNLSYIHKVKEGRDIWFFGNSSDEPVDVSVRLRGRHRLKAWDPHTGQTAECSGVPAVEAGCEVTRVRLKLPAVRSLFLVGVQ